ncbi:hypothetical protein BCR43DRAFT_244266 [Syncephalastrum racemosum]|uniref:Zn(2)-C6 fungal-type domain-containing protein n=1 Tax=Syncephalastrum racemosum TaxID=13706 RepID=A0A1X2HF84_SYNRA|nr:hypothetical protein BCR43DRAFT_244266 [Syncephalastrum racemosum]
MTRKSTADQPTRRVKVTLACAVCRKKKVKCDGVQPTCSRCSHMGLPCQYSDPPKKRGPPKGYVEVIENRAHRIESLLGGKSKSLVHPPPPPLPPPPIQQQRSQQLPQSSPPQQQHYLPPAINAATNITTAATISAAITSSHSPSTFSLANDDIMAVVANAVAEYRPPRQFLGFSV